jgi:hypothetical protein
MVFILKEALETKSRSKPPAERLADEAMENLTGNFSSVEKGRKIILTVNNPRGIPIAIGFGKSF